MLYSVNMYCELISNFETEKVHCAKVSVYYPWPMLSPAS